MSLAAALLFGAAGMAGGAAGGALGRVADLAPPSDHVSSNTQSPHAAPLMLSPEQMFVLAEKLVAVQHLREAISFLMPLTANRNADYRAEARARIARIYLALGEKREAAAWFQRLLEEKPDAAAVRIELADVLMQLNDTGAARRQFQRAAASGTLPDDVARALGRAGAALQDNAPVQFSMRMGIAPNSNINNATQAQTVDIYGLPFTLSQTARAQSGVGLTEGGDLVLQHRIDASSRMIAEVTEDGTFYRDTSFNDVALTGSLGPEIFDGTSSIHPALVAGERWYGAQRLYTLYGVSLLYRRAISRSAQLSVTLSDAHLEYPHLPELSGQVSSATLAYERVLNPRSSLRVSVTTSRNLAMDPAQSYWSAGTHITISRDMGRFTAFSRLGITRTIGDAPFSYLGVGRDDRLEEAEVGLIYKRFSLWGFSPQARLKYSNNSSPVALYAYRQTRFDLSMVKTF